MTIDLQLLAQDKLGIVWTQACDDLNLNLMVLEPGRSIAEHVNAAFDVLVVGVRGAGAISIDGEEDILGPGRIAVIPRGTRRSISAGPPGLAYLTCHRRRQGLQPGPVRH